MKRQKRQTHSKSRRGCQNCKNRHVKCDEQLPTCANCTVRKISCLYPPSQSDLATSCSAVVKRASSSPGPNSGQSLVTSPSSSLSSSATVFSSTPEFNRLLELELMHRWSTRTYMGLCSVPEDQYYLQNYVPQAALKTTYLMNGILAISAVDLFRSSGQSSHLVAALEYSNKASASFRAQLSDINESNLHLLYYFASIAAVFNFAVPDGKLGVMERMKMGFDMLLGAYNIALTNMHWLLDSYSSLSALIGYGTTSIDILDQDTLVALERLTSVRKQLRVPDVNERISKQEDALSTKFAVAMGKFDMYELAIAQLMMSFAEDLRGLIKGYCLTMIAVAGPDFALAMKNLEPMAVFIMMYFGVLLDRSARDPMAWWISSMGKDLVKGCSEFLWCSSIASMSDVQEGISWTRNQVGLEALV